MALYPKRTAEHTLRFLEKVIEEMPFPIQRIKTDRGLEFFDLKVQKGSWIAEDASHPKILRVVQNPLVQINGIPHPFSAQSWETL